MYRNPYYIPQVAQQAQRGAPYYYMQAPTTKEMNPTDDGDLSPPKKRPRRRSTTNTNAGVSKEDNKQRHNASERKRRDKINQLLEELRSLVPNCESSKSSILESTTDHITKLKEQSQQLDNLNKELAAENAELMNFISKANSLAMLNPQLQFPGMVHVPVIPDSPKN